LFERRRAAGSRGALMVMAGLGLGVVVLLARAAWGASGMHAAPGLLRPGTIAGLSFMLLFVVLLVASFGFVFMSKDRADEVNRRLAALDELTGVANRRSIIAALDRDVGRAIRTREPLAVMMVDIDFFKHVNDTHGHLAGDRVLRNVADVIRSRIRAQDIVGRYGGEEFLVVLCDTTAQGAQQLAEQLREAVQASSCAWEGQPLNVTVSVGVFGGRLEPGDSWDLLIHAADNALYQAKQGGRNRVEVAPALGRVARRGRAMGSPETFPSSLG
jgi:diguanylate cyclase (GGDEF)-like protein